MLVKYIGNVMMESNVIMGFEDVIFTQASFSIQITIQLCKCGCQNNGIVFVQSSTHPYICKFFALKKRDWQTEHKIIQQNAANIMCHRHQYFAVTNDWQTYIPANIEPHISYVCGRWSWEDRPNSQSHTGDRQCLPILSNVSCILDLPLCFQCLSQ